MALTSGTKLGPYEIESPIGAGGMGEVYRAKDTRLDRTVAIKILPTHLSANPSAATNSVPWQSGVSYFALKSRIGAFLIRSALVSRRQS